MTTTSGVARRAASRPRARRVAASTTALLAGAMIAAGATPASATLTGPGVDQGQNITVFHDIDMVAVFGFGPVGSRVTVSVVRNGAPIATASGPAVDNGDGPGLEVNHGVDGTPAPGDCWNGATPDIRPGDIVRVSHAGDLDEVTVDNIRFTGSPGEAGGDVVVHGVALRANDDVIGADALDSADFRAQGGKLRMTAEVEENPSVRGGFTMRYNAPFVPDRNRDGLNQDQIRSVLLNQSGHSIGFGHTEPLPRESMLLDGIDDPPGAHTADGCGGTTPDPGPDPDPGPGPGPGPNPPPAPTTRTVTLTPQADTMLRGSDRRQNFGESKILRSDVRAPDSTTHRDISYLRFKTPALAAGERITAARLSVQVTDKTPNGPAIYPTSSGWSEAMTWAGKPQRLQGAVGNFGRMETGRRSTAVSVASARVAEPSYELHAESSNGLVFASKESQNRAHMPHLIVTIQKG